jgi:hypothetical protein
MEGEAYAAFYPILDAGRVDALFCGHIQCVRRGWQQAAAAGGCGTARLLITLAQPLTHTPSTPTPYTPPTPLAATTVRHHFLPGPPLAAGSTTP